MIYNTTTNKFQGYANGSGLTYIRVVMSEREYIVTLNKGVDYAQFNQEMIAAQQVQEIFPIEL